MQTPVRVSNDPAAAEYALCLTEFKDYVNEEKYNVPGNYLIGHSAGSYGLSGIMLWSPSDKWGMVAMATGLTPVPGKSFLQRIATDVYHACVEE